MVMRVMLITFVTGQWLTVDRLSVYLGIDLRMHRWIDQRIRADAGLSKHQPGTDEAGYAEPNKIESHDFDDSASVGSAPAFFARVQQSHASQ